MLLKRIFTPTGELDYISLAHTGTSPEQNFSTGLVTDMLNQGLMEINDDDLVFHVYPEDLRYTIKRIPGRYCLHCGEKLPDDNSGELARLHVAMKHPGDTSKGAGYEMINHFECVLDADQHEQYKKSGHPVTAHFPLMTEV